MFGALQFLLIADIAVSLVSAPVLATGIGLGNGAGGTSFPQKAQLDRNVSDREAALIVFKGVCSKEDWDKKKSGFAKGLPYPDSAEDIKTLQKNVDEIDWARVCPGNTTRGISIIGDASSEIKFLLQDKWDRRLLYNIVYLYEKRFLSANGAQVSCQQDGKSSPDMTIAVHYDALGNIHTDSNGSPVKPEGIDMEDDETSSGNISPHANFQGLDIQTFGCTYIYDDQDELQAIVPNSISTAQNMSFETEGQTALGPVQTASTLGLSDKATKLAQEAQKPKESAFAAAASSLTEDGTGALFNLKGLKVPSGKLGNLTDSAETDSSARVAARIAESKLDLPELSLGTNDLAKSGAKVLSEKMKIDVASAVEKGGTAFNKILAGTSAFALGISDDSFKLLQSGKTKEGLRLLAGQEMSDKLKAELNGQELEKLKSSGMLPEKLQSEVQKKLDAQEPTLSKIYSQGKSAVAKIDESRQNSSLYKVAKSLENKSLSSAAINNLKNFADTAKQSDIIKNLENESKDLASSLTAFKGANNNEISQLLEFVESYEAAPSRQDYASSLTSDVTENLFKEYYETLNDSEKSIIASIIGTQEPTGLQLKKAFEEGKFKEASEIETSISDFISCGLSSSEAKELATAINQGTNSAKEILAKFKKVGVSLDASDYTKSEKKKSFLRSLTAAKISAVSGKTYSEVKNTLESKDSKKIEDLVSGYAKQAGQDAKQAVAFLKNKSGEFAEEGLRQQIETFKEGLSSLPDEVKSSADEIESLFTKAMKSPEAKKEVGDSLKKIGFSSESANELSKGNFTNKVQGLAAASISANSKINPEEALRLVKGEADKDMAYSFANASFTDSMKQQGYDFAIDTKVLAEGSTQDREEMASRAGEEVLKSEIENFAKEKKIPKEALETISKEGKIDFDEKSLDDMAGSIAENVKSVSAKDIATAIKDQNGKKLNEIAKLAGTKDFGTLIAKIDNINPESAKSITASWQSDKNKAFADLKEAAKNAEVAGQVSKSISGNDAKTKDETDSAIKEGKTEKLEKMAKEKGYDSAASMISDKSEGKITKDDARLMVENLKKDPKTAASQVYDSLKTSYELDAAQRVASMTGGAVDANQIKGLYKELKENNLTQEDVTTVGKQTIENVTGINIDSLKNADTKIANAGKTAFDNAKNVLSTQAVGLQAQSVGAGVVLGSVGNELAKIDPTGGLATGYAMGIAQKQLLNIAGGPALMAVGLALDPQAVMSSIKTNIKMATKALSNPIGFVSGLFGGSKPEAQSSAKNPLFAKENMAKEKTSEKKAEKDQEEQEKAQDETGSVSNDANDSETEETADNSEPETQQDKSAPEKDNEETVASSYSTTASDYVPKQKFSQSYLAKTALRTLDQITEDLLILYGAQTSADETIKAAVWNKYMGSIELPERSLAAKQIVLPRVLADEDDANIVSTYIDHMYSNEGGGSYLGLENLISQIKYVYGTDFDAKENFGRTPALSFSKKMNYIHISF